MSRRFHAYDPKHGRDARLLSPPRQILGLSVDWVGNTKVVHYEYTILRADRWLPWHFGKPVIERWTYGEHLSHHESIQQGREWNRWITAHPVDSPAGPAPGAETARVPRKINGVKQKLRREPNLWEPRR